MKKYTKEEIKIAQEILDEIFEDIEGGPLLAILGQRIAKYKATKGNKEYLMLISWLRYAKVFLPYRDVYINDKGDFRRELMTNNHGGKKAVCVFSGTDDIPIDYAIDYSWFRNCSVSQLITEIEGADSIILNPTSDYIEFPVELLGRVFPLMQQLEENIEIEKTREELNSLISGANFAIGEAPKFRIRLKDGREFKGRMLYLCFKEDVEMMVIEDEEKGRIEVPLSLYRTREEIKE